MESLKGSDPRRSRADVPMNGHPYIRGTDMEAIHADKARHDEALAAWEREGRQAYTRPIITGIYDTPKGVRIIFRHYPNASRPLVGRLGSFLHTSNE